MMRHRHGCTGKAVLDQVTALGPRQWFIFKCDACGAIELRKTPKEKP